ncbi:MAG TPA: hypothetical protein VMQ93_16850 [Novosphingobium sp.]|nr:hypothetical protein [Novosphingobium sp.]
MRRHASLPVLAIALLPPAPAVAQTREQPYIEVDMSLFTGRNPFLLPGDDEMTSGGEIGARGKATVPVDHRTMLELDGAVAYRRYDRRYGPFVTGHALAALDHRNDEHLNLRTEASYERYLPLEGMVASIDAAIDPVSLQERFQINEEVRWRPDRVSTMTGMVMLSRIAPRNSPLLTRTDATTFVLSAERRIARTTWLGLETLVTHSTSDDGGDARSTTARFKGGARLARGLTAELGIGLAKISRRDPGGPRGGGAGQFTASGSLCYDPRQFRLCISGRVAPVVTSFDGIRREKSLNARFDLRTMPRANFSLEADYRSMPGTGRLSDPEVLRASARYEHQLDGRVKLHIGADYDRRTGLARQTLDTWTVRVGATIRIPSL